MSSPGGARSSPWPLLTLAILELGIIAGSITASLLVSSNIERAPLAAGAAATGIIFFVGVLLFARGEQPVTIVSMRHAIAAGFTAMFLFLLSINVFFANTLSAAGKEFTDAFIDLMKIIIPFYFVSEATVQGVAKYSEEKTKAVEIASQTETRK
jgi:hypothetical protein